SQRTFRPRVHNICVAPTSTPPEARLVVIDDEPAIRDLLTASLRFAGFEVFDGETGAEALDLVRVKRPDLVVLDVMLPDMDGFTVTRRLRQQGHRVPIVFLTARDGASNAVHGLTVGGDDYVTKPFSLEDLVARILAVQSRSVLPAYPTVAGVLRYDYPELK